MSTQKVWDMSLKLFSLNIEGSKHIERWLPVVLSAEYDVVCLQEVFLKDMPLIADAIKMKGYFCRMLDVAEENRYKITPNGKWGLGLFIRHPHITPHAFYYSGTEQVKIFHEPEDASRVIFTTEVSKDGQTYRIATTHFTWTPDGESTELQRQDFLQLSGIIAKHSDWVLCGDFNAPRGKKTFSWFTQLFKDNLPAEIQSTIDPVLHIKGAELQLAVDTIFSTPEYQVNNCKMMCGLSDHCGLEAEIARV